MSPQFPELQGHIHGEESNEFKNGQGESRGSSGAGSRAPRPPNTGGHGAVADVGVLAGETVAVRVCATPGDTAALLLSVLEPERAAAELLAAAVHRDVALEDVELAGVALSIPPQDLAIWIDPIGEGVLGEGGLGTPPPCTAAEPWRIRLHPQTPPTSTSAGARTWPPSTASPRRGCARRWCSSGPMTGRRAAPCWVSSTSPSSAGTP